MEKGRVDEKNINGLNSMGLLTLKKKLNKTELNNIQKLQKNGVEIEVEDSSNDL